MEDYNKATDKFLLVLFYASPCEIHRFRRAGNPKNAFRTIRRMEARGLVIIDNDMVSIAEKGAERIMKRQGIPIRELCIVARERAWKIDPIHIYRIMCEDMDVPGSRMKEVIERLGPNKGKRVKGVVIQRKKNTIVAKSQNISVNLGSGEVITDISEAMENGGIGCSTIWEVMSDAPPAIKEAFLEKCLESWQAPVPLLEVIDRDLILNGWIPRITHDQWKEWDTLYAPANTQRSTRQSQLHKVGGGKARTSTSATAA